MANMELELCAKVWGSVLFTSNLSSLRHHHIIWFICNGVGALRRSRQWQTTAMKTSTPGGIAFVASHASNSAVQEYQQTAMQRDTSLYAPPSCH
eukprot:scaffold105746_cov20-Tisochrysis_lutea.AAC.2